jgi:hypothetical protein
MLPRHIKVLVIEYLVSAAKPNNITGHATSNGKASIPSKA